MFQKETATKNVFILNVIFVVLKKFLTLLELVEYIWKFFSFYQLFLIRIFTLKKEKGV